MNLRPCVTIDKQLQTSGEIADEDLLEAAKRLCVEDMHASNSDSDEEPLPPKPYKVLKALDIVCVYAQMESLEDCTTHALRKIEHVHAKIFSLKKQKTLFDFQ